MTKWQVLFVKSISGIIVTARRNGRGPWLSPSQLPQYVRDYLSLIQLPGAAGLYVVNPEDIPNLDYLATLDTIARQKRVNDLTVRGWVEIKEVFPAQPPVATFSIDLRWSLWTEDLGDAPPEVVAALAALQPGESVVILTAPKKEIRSGNVTVARTKSGYRAAGDFYEGWDSVDALMDTLRVPQRSRESFAETLPWYGDEDPGVQVSFDLKAKTLPALFKRVDAEEARLIKDGQVWWAGVEALWKKTKK